MANKLSLLGLPLKTWIVVGGLFVISALSPTITALIINYREGLDDE